MDLISIETNEVDFEAEDNGPNLPRLTAKQHAFVIAVLDGNTAADAYRKAYSPNGIPNTIWRAAHRAMSHPSIQAHIQHAYQLGLSKGLVTMEGQVTRLRQLSAKAEKAERLETAVAAEDKINKLAGLYSSEDSGRSALEAVGAGLVGLVGKELAAQIAKAQGMTLDLTAETVPEATDTGPDTPK